MSEQLGIATAALAGVASFLSPCVLPLVPAYLSFLTGLSVGELSDPDRSRARILLPALLFIAGFSIVFVALGATASVAGQLLAEYRVIVERIAGLLIIAFGVLMLGIFRVPWLYGEARADMSRARSFGVGASFVMGMSFAAGWTPCVGPILGSILALAGSAGSVSYGVTLLLAYSLGLGVPFLAVALLLDRLGPAMRWLNRHAAIVNRVAGSILVLVGLLVLTGRLSLLASWLTRVLPSLNV